jgi:SAM-dependent methyltransferase
MVYDVIKNLQLDVNSIVVNIGNSGNKDADIFELINKCNIHKLTNEMSLDEYINDKIKKIDLMIIYPKSKDYLSDILNGENIKNVEFIYINYSNRGIYFTSDEIQEGVNALPGKWSHSEYTSDTILLKNESYRDSLLDPHGCWGIKDLNEHYFDYTLAKEIKRFIKREHVINVVDFGCGPGEYVKYLKANNIDVIGFDGNLLTPEITNGECGIQDLAVPFNLGNKFDLVISLEVGEHIPEEFETTFIENLVNHTNNYLVLSWGIPGQGGYGHVNCKTNESIKDKICSYGFTCYTIAEDRFRYKATATWFKNTIMVFKKVKKDGE